MEKSLDKCLDEISHLSGVTGVLCADKQGLCLGVRGKAVSDTAGAVAAIMEQVSKLEPESKSPVVLLESETSQCLLQRQDGVSMAIHKSTVLSTS